MVSTMGGSSMAGIPGMSSDMTAEFMKLPLPIVLATQHVSAVNTTYWGAESGEQTRRKYQGGSRWGEDGVTASAQGSGRVGAAELRPFPPLGSECSPSKTVDAISDRGWKLRPSQVIIFFYFIFVWNGIFWRIWTQFILQNSTSIRYESIVVTSRAVTGKAHCFLWSRSKT